MNYDDAPCITQLLYEDQQQKMKTLEDMPIKQRRRLMRELRSLEKIQDNPNYVYENDITVTEFCVLYTIEKINKRRRY